VPRFGNFDQVYFRCAGIRHLWPSSLRTSNKLFNFASQLAEPLPSVWQAHRFGTSSVMSEASVAKYKNRSPIRASHVKTAAET
jgi:hypothetical protein